MDQLSIEDEEAEWAREQGVPSFEEPFIQRFLQSRDALVAQEKKQRSDHAFRETLSPMAAEASAIVSAIRFEEQQTIWTKEYEDSLAATEGDIYPGMMFNLARDRMENTKLWKIIKKMPKGALLHCHLEAMVDLDWLLDELFAVGGMHIMALEPMTTPELREITPIEFKWLRSAATTDATATMWSDTYKAEDAIPVEVAAESFPNGGRDAFKAWLRSRVTITAEESLKHHHGPNAIWKKFTSCFGVMATLLHYEPIWRGFIRRMLKALLDDGVQYVDLRAAFNLPFYRTGCEKSDEDFSGMVGMLNEEIEAFKASEEGKTFWGARLIWTSVRNFGTKYIIENMRACIALKQQFPDLIAGYDLVGQEDLGQPLAALTPELFWFKKTCAENGVDIPFFFHAGETLGDGNETDENLFDAILLGTRRIGHGFSLYKHPLLIDMVKEKKILIESCPVSNEVLRLTGSIMSHPLPALLARGVPVALCNDDPSVFGLGSNGMTHDFWQALQGWENMGLEGLASVAENSIRYATFQDYKAKEWLQVVKDGSFGRDIRARRMKEWSRAWEKFCQWIVLEFGADEDLDGEDGLEGID